MAVVDCAGWIEPLNLQCILVNTFAGTMEIFIFIALIFIAGMGAYFRMLNTTILIMFGLFAIIMAQYISGIYFLAMLIAGLFIGFALSRIVKK